MNDLINITEIKSFLDFKYEKFNNPKFIESDPIQIPHLWSRKEDIEISGFITASIAWGQRKTIIHNARSIMKLMDDAPYDFIINHKNKDLDRFNHSGHRTFKPEDLKFFIKSLQNIYMQVGSIEAVFTNSNGVFNGLVEFYKLFFSISHLPRSRKHVANVAVGSAGKRLNMYLRWMVRKDGRGVDFGIWDSVKPSELFIPLDVHTGNIARKLGILKRTQNDWKAVTELTDYLRKLDSSDPVKYDFALFGVGVNEDF